MERSSLKNTIHPTAILEGEIVIGEGNVIGPHVVIRGNVSIGNNNDFKTGIVIENNVTIGSHNTIYPYVSIGALGEMGSKGDRLAEEGKVVIGDEVTIREFVCIHSPVYALETRIHDKVYLMNKSYVAHDCQVGKGSVLSAGVLLAGRVEIGEYVNLGLGATVHQRMHIGSYAMVGMQAVITSDILPYATVAGNPARILRFNRRGVESLGYSEQWMLEVEKFFHNPNVEKSNTDNLMLKEILAFLHLHPDSLFLVKQ
jgi:UDP-N-acetylglucosamine acyltransferase